MRFLFFIITACIFSSAFSQAKKDSLIFKSISETKHTCIANQYKTGTCWSFATVSFLESEILRKSNTSVDLSEMFFVRHAYPQKALNYIRMHGKANFGQGGQAHDVINIMKEKGLMPESAYGGINYNYKRHDHIELERILAGMLKSLTEIQSDGLTEKWDDAFVSVLETYLGVLPSDFEVDGKKTNAVQYSKSLGLIPEDYVEITSYTHFPFDTWIDLDVPDNWSHDKYFNVTLNELLLIAENAINKGYSVCWDGDISEPGFSHKDGIANVPEENLRNLSDEQKKSILMGGNPEVDITQEIRQKAFEKYQTTDDHLMHIVGISEDQFGMRYFHTKNSWGENSNAFEGMLNMSYSYFKKNTIAIMVHKDALPKEIKEKIRTEK